VSPSTTSSSARNPSCAGAPPRATPPRHTHHGDHRELFLLLSVSFFLESERFATNLVVSSSISSCPSPFVFYTVVTMQYPAEHACPPWPCRVSSCTPPASSCLSAYMGIPQPHARTCHTLRRATSSWSTLTSSLPPQPHRTRYLINTASAPQGFPPRSGSSRTAFDPRWRYLKTTLFLLLHVLTSGPRWSAAQHAMLTGRGGDPTHHRPWLEAQL
jgi:hypothetical protein